jgi:hypothetical protein
MKLLCSAPTTLNEFGFSSNTDIGELFSDYFDWNFTGMPLRVKVRYFDSIRNTIQLLTMNFNRHFFLKFRRKFGQQALSHGFHEFSQKIHRKSAQMCAILGKKNECPNSCPKVRHFVCFRNFSLSRPQGQIREICSQLRLPLYNCYILGSRRGSRIGFTLSNDNTHFAYQCMPDPLHNAFKSDTVVEVEYPVNS